MFYDFSFQMWFLRVIAAEQFGSKRILYFKLPAERHGKWGKHEVFRFFITERFAKLSPESKCV